MAKDIDLKKGELSRHVNKAAKAIADGFIIVIPMEHSYAFACDAFRADAVRAMHVLRGDPLFTAAQVIVGTVKTTEGIIREVTPEIKGLMKKFWPGMVSLNLRPQMGLSWDLGDNNQLDRVSVRLPKAKFAKALVSQTGPLAIASAARKGMAAPQSLSDVLVLDSDVALKFDNGKLRKGPISTVIEADETGVRVLRVGAVTLEEIQAIVPGATGA
ncbi:MAG: Sua5/YciO/YrdC/YwlC family protein [Acidobacteriota bacterium]|jgi:tRNA threonylcarbamoyl adenosine modification protein (Sua5/YciO/YrdC/YwlC family)|nr:Sua5/YciO/YrdC/YwlC family protein [Acidobacteriota bacterium]